MSELDDFFAKKDRKKSKGKSKFTTTDEIAKKLEETGKRTEKLKKEKPPPTNTGQEGEETGPIIPEDEWKDFEEEKKDYTGLKIQNITLSEVEAEEGIEMGQGEGEGGLEENEAGELVPRRKISSGPWKCVPSQGGGGGDDVPAPEVEKRLPMEEERTPARSSTSSTYIPPFARNSPATPSPHISQRISKNRTAPDVNSEDAFPTLSASKNVEVMGAWGKKKRDENVGFEEVRNSKSHSSRIDSTSRMTPGKLTLGNKYGALTNDQS